MATLDLLTSAWKSPEQIADERVEATTSRSKAPFRELDFYRGKRILLWTRKPGLGDRVMNAICCDLLRNRYGLDVWFGLQNDAGDREFPELLEGVPHYPYSPDLRRDPLADHRAPRGFEGGIDHCGARHPFDFIIDFRYAVHSPYNAIFQCLMEFGIRKLDLPLAGFRVKNLPAPRERYDVVVCSTCAGWKPVRAYRRADELVAILRGKGMKVCDLSQTNIRTELGTAQLLSLVAAAGVYVGVETGPTHLVSGVHRQAVAIQSGIHKSAFWNIYDRTHVVEADWACGGRRCHVRRHEQCVIPEGVCIDRFAPRDLAQLIEQQVETPMTRETSKCTARRMAQGHLQKLVGSGIDIGAGDDAFQPISGTCRPWDRKHGDGDAAVLAGIEANSLDYVYSSHCLEHLADPLRALRRWIEVIKPGGYLYLVVPDFDRYEGGVAIRNRFHRTAFTLERPSDPKIPLWNVSEVFQAECSESLSLLYSALCDDHFDYSLDRSVDQTRRGAVCHIEMLAQKKQKQSVGSATRIAIAKSEPPAKKEPKVRPAIQAEAKDKHDQNALRAVPSAPNGRYRPAQLPPMLFTREGHAAYLGDLFRGSAAFLVCGGPSLVTHDLAQLELRGVLTMALNNAATIIRPRLWCSVDDPGHFSDCIWRDPGIFKFVPMSHFEKGFLVRNEEERLIPSGERVGDMPGVFGFRRNEHFVAERWLYEDTFNWGNRGDRVDAHGNKGSRSVMYPALRLLYHLGVRKVYLLGCDFRMELGKQNYAFEQDRSRNSVNGNNHSYQVLNSRLGHLKPHFEAAGFSVFNCTANSGLTVFPHREFGAAVDDAVSTLPKQIITRGMYDGADVIRTAPPKPGVPPKKTPGGAVGAATTERRPIAETTVPGEGGPAPAEVTLVTLVEADEVPAFRRAWFQWKKRLAPLWGAPVIVIHDSRMRIRSAGLGFLATDPNVRLVPYDLGSRATASEAALIDIPREHVGTPWYLRIKACASAGDRASPWRWGPSWRKASLHVEQGTAAPLNAATMRVLDVWWSGGRKVSRRQANRVSKRTKVGESAAALFVRTEWLRKVMGDFPSDAAELTDDGVLQYCARRRHEPVARLDVPLLTSAQLIDM
jgi:SAM-dependent methyltransferase